MREEEEVNGNSRLRKDVIQTSLLLSWMFSDIYFVSLESSFSPSFSLLIFLLGLLSYMETLDDNDYDAWLSKKKKTKGKTRRATWSDFSNWLLGLLCHEKRDRTLEETAKMLFSTNGVDSVWWKEIGCLDQLEEETTGRSTSRLHLSPDSLTNDLSFPDNKRHEEKKDFFHEESHDEPVWLREVKSSQLSIFLSRLLISLVKISREIHSCRRRSMHFRNEGNWSLTLLQQQDYILWLFDFGSSCQTEEMPSRDLWTSDFSSGRLKSPKKDLKETTCLSLPLTCYGHWYTEDEGVCN